MFVLLLLLLFSHQPKSITGTKSFLHRTVCIQHELMLSHFETNTHHVNNSRSELGVFVIL
jgi:hypothetical protein